MFSPGEGTEDEGGANDRTPGPARLVPKSASDAGVAVRASGEGTLGADEGAGFGRGPTRGGGRVNCCGFVTKGALFGAGLDGSKEAGRSSCAKSEGPCFALS